jgi:hypothetical protein
MMMMMMMIIIIVSFIACILFTFRWIVLLVTMAFCTTRDLWQCLMQETPFQLELVGVVHRKIVTNMGSERELKTVACG